MTKIHKKQRKDTNKKTSGKKADVFENLRKCKRHVDF